MTLIKGNLLFATILLLMGYLITSCVEDKYVEPATDQFLCSGNGSSSYFPLKKGNKWKYTNFHFGDAQTSVSGTQIYNSKVYFKIDGYLTSYPGNNNYTAVYLREDSITHDIYRYTNNAEVLELPGTPFLNEALPDSQIVTELNGSLWSGPCSYTGLLEVHRHNGFFWSNKGYKKGLGLVYYYVNADEASSFLLNSVTLH